MLADEIGVRVVGVKGGLWTLLPNLKGFEQVYGLA